LINYRSTKQELLCTSRQLQGSIAADAASASAFYTRYRIFFTDPARLFNKYHAAPGGY
jgi:hypothetical protein